MSLAQASATTLADVEGRVPTGTARWTQPPAELLTWLRETAVPVSTDPSVPVDDLAALGHMVDGARIVALGESTHGTSEFFRLKHRLARYLITEAGFTAFAIEGFPAECMVVNDYIQLGAGDPIAAVRGIYGGGFPWDTEEMLEFVEWLRAHNASLPDGARKVGFYGFDIHGTGCAGWLIDYLRGRSELFSADLMEGLRRVDSAERLLAFQRLPDDQQQSVLDILDRLTAELEAHREPLSAVDERGWGLARRHAESIRQVVAIPTPDRMFDRMAPRDRGQAHLAKFLLDMEGPEGRLITWAHNGHVFRGEFFKDVPAMGVHLDRMLGSAYVVIGLAFGAGSFRAGDMSVEGYPRREFTVETASTGSLDGALAQHDAPAYLIDLRTAPAEVGAWLDSTVPLRSIGGGHSDAPDTAFWVERVPRRLYDIVAFVQNTSAAQEIPR